MITRYTKINASDYEDGVVIFKKVTDGEGNATFQQLTAEEMQTELGAVDPNNYDANTFLFVEDDGSGTNNIVSPQSISEVKSLLGLPSKVYKAFVDCNGTSTPTVTVIKNSFSGTLTWTYSETGVVTLTSGSSEFTINKILILATVNRSTTDRTVEVSRDNVNGALITFKTFQTDGNAVDSVDFFVSIEVYS